MSFIMMLELRNRSGRCDEGTAAWMPGQTEMKHKEAVMDRKSILDIKIEANGPHILFFEAGGEAKG